MTKEVKESFLCVHSLRAQSSLLGSHYYRSMKHLKQANSEKKTLYSGCFLLFIQLKEPLHGIVLPITCMSSHFNYHNQAMLRQTYPKLFLRN